MYEDLETWKKWKSLENNLPMTVSTIVVYVDKNYWLLKVTSGSVRIVRSCFLDVTSILSLLSLLFSVYQCYQEQDLVG